MPRRHKGLKQLAMGLATELQASKQHRRAQKASRHQAIDQHIPPPHGATNPDTRMTE